MKRNASSLTALVVAGLAFGCAEPTSRPLVFEPDFDVTETSLRVYVLNTQLRGIIHPEITPSPAWGHVQVKLTDRGDGTFGVAWKGKLFNPNREIFAGAFIIDQDHIGGGTVGDGGTITSGLVFKFFERASASCGIVNFNSQAITDEEHMPADIAMNMIANPELFQVLMTTGAGPRVVGTFGVMDPTTVLGWNPQPDPPGRLRCDAI